MRNVRICCLLTGLIILTGCAPRQEQVPTLTPAPPTAGPSPTPTSVQVVLTPIVVTGAPRATLTPTIEPTPASEVAYNPAVTGPVTPEEVVFIRGVGGAPLSTETQTVELWAIARDASNARLVTTYNPKQLLFAFEPSPDRRFAVVSDTPGAVLIDFEAGTKTVLYELVDGWIGQFAWTPDSKRMYYAVHDTAAGSVTVYSQTVDPMSAPQPVQGALTLNGVGLYPHRVMPDGRVLMYAASTEFFHDAAVFDPVTATVVPLDTSAYGDLIVLDVRADGMVLFQPLPPADAVNPLMPVYLGTIDAAGRFAGAFQATDPGYGAARFLLDGGFAALSYLNPQASQLVLFAEPTNAAIVQPTMTVFPGDPDSEEGFVALDAATLLVRRSNPPELWLYPLDGSPAYELVDFSLLGP